MPYLTKFVDGQLCVCFDELCLDKPQRILTYWPTGCSAASATFNGIKEDVVLEHEPFSQGYLYRESGWLRPIKIDLPEGGKTKSIKVEYFEVPAPRVGKGTELRWWRGHWQKLTRTGRRWLAV